MLSIGGCALKTDREIICGFEVTEQRKKVWATELQMLKTFAEICGRHKLKYFAGHGTLLGCARHKGFIPWDDDVDLLMKRDEYEEFIRIVSAELPNHYTLCNASGHIQIRDNRTTALLQIGYNSLSSGKNCGIFIDVFPLDYLADDYKTRKKEARKIWFYGLCSRRGGSKRKVSARQKLFDIAARIYNLFHSPEKVAEKARNPYAGESRVTNTLGVVTFAPGNENWAWPAEWFDATTELPFEDTVLSAPAKYNDILTKEYGNYMKIPENKGGSLHTCYFDPDKSYTEYVGISEDEYSKLFEDYIL